MSAFVVIYERSNTIGDSAVFHRTMERLKHRGPDGSDVFFAANITMGHWHFWTTPEEVGELQPLELNGLPFRIVLDGRIDNREELFAKLNIPPAKGKSLSDAALILQSYAHWGKDCLERFVGEFALVIFDEQKNELICARDHLGDRTLFYNFQGTRLVIASEAWAVAGADYEKPELNERAIAYYFGLKIPKDGQTLFNNIYELLPAHVMKVNAENKLVWRYWQPDLSKKIHYKTDEEYAGHFLSLLEESVRCRMRSNVPVGIMMSGGLDSTSIASLAARMLKPQVLTTFSYIFDEFPECDERYCINEIESQWNTRSIQIPVDDCWPYQRLHRSSLINANQPGINPYKLHEARGFQYAKNEGVRVLLTGGFGDTLYVAGENWLADLLSEGKFFIACRELIYHIHEKGFQHIFNAGYIRRTARWLINLIPGGSRLHRKSSEDAWLTTIANSYIRKDAEIPNPAFQRHAAALLGLMNTNLATQIFLKASHFSIELRNPFRDRRLIEYALALPAYQLYFHGEQKHILRSAMRGILPESLRIRKKSAPLFPFYYYGLKQGKDYVQECLDDSNAIWNKYIDRSWLLKRFKPHDEPDLSEVNAFLLWLIISFNEWYQVHTNNLSIHGVFYVK